MNRHNRLRKKDLVRSQLKKYYMPVHHYATKYGVHLESSMLKMPDHFKYLKKEIEMIKLIIDGMKATSSEAKKRVKVEKNTIREYNVD